MRLLGLALALPYGVIAYMVAGKMGLLGEAQRSARYKPSRLTLFYERRLGYLGTYFNYKIWLVQMFEVYIQCFGKVTKIHVVDSFFKHRSGEVWSVSTVLAIMINVAYPAIFLGAKTARLQRDLVFTCVEINQCVRCTRQFFTKSFLSDGVAALVPSSGEESASPCHRAGVASMAWRTTM